MNPIILITLTGGTTYHQYINQFVSDNYEEILEVCEKVTKNTPFESVEVLSELVLFIQGRQDKLMSLVQIEGKNDKGLMRYIAQWCYNQIRLYKANAGLSNFRSRHQPKPSKTMLKQHHENLEDEITYDTNKNIYDYVIKSKLTTTEKALYDLYIMQGKNVREIKKMIPALGKFPLYKMIRELKKKIKTECELYIKDAA